MNGLQWIGVLLLFSTVLTAVDLEANLLNSRCSAVKSTNVTLFNENLNGVLVALSATIASSGFATNKQVRGTYPVYGLAQCRKDKSPSDCLKCIAVGEKQIRNCSTVSGGRVIYDGCFLRYESEYLYAQAMGPSDKPYCGATKATSERNQFFGNGSKSDQQSNNSCSEILRVFCCTNQSRAIKYYHLCSSFVPAFY